MGGCGTVILILTLVLALICDVLIAIAGLLGLIKENHKGQWDVDWYAEYSFAKMFASLTYVLF